MTTQFGNAKIRIELDPREAEEALARLQAKVAGLDRALSGGGPEGQPRREGQSGDAHGQRSGGDSATASDGVAPTMRSTGPGRFGAQNIRGLLSAPGLLGAVPVVGGALSFGAQLEMKYGAAAEGMVAGLTGQLLRESGMEDSAGGEILDRVTKLVLQMQDSVRGVVQSLDAKLRAIEPALEAVLMMGKGQLLAAGGLDKGFLSQYAENMFEIQSTLLRKDKDVRDKTLREVSEAGGSELVKSLLNMAKR